LSIYHYSRAVEDFRSARRKAALKDILTKLTGQTDDLLPFEEVRKRLQAVQASKANLVEVPLDHIVGSVGRYQDFTRDFLPRASVDEGRWARVKTAISDGSQIPPVDLYRIGEGYFVLDGNHRISIARQVGATHIQAYVTEFHSPVPLSPDENLDDLIIKAEYADYLKLTHLDVSRPDADLSVTSPGRYRELAEHIDVHRYFMGIDHKQEISYEEAAANWYDKVYLPIVHLIREKGILRDFPKRSEADLYIWVSKYRKELSDALGLDIKTQAALSDLVSRTSPTPTRKAARAGRKVLNSLTPDVFERGPASGQWRAERRNNGDNAPLFDDILVPIAGDGTSWPALEQALVIAQLEGARIYGLHVTNYGAQDIAGEKDLLIEEFTRCCENTKVSRKLIFENGTIARVLCDRSRWVDLMVIKLSYPPAPGPIAKLGSGFHTLVRRCPTPILAVPGEPLPIQKVLLAYDGSPKADEALYISAYIAGRWNVSLNVLTVKEAATPSSRVIDDAKKYLNSYGIQAYYFENNGPVADSILQTAAEAGCDLILMGGYGYSPVGEIVLGSSVDQVLRESDIPTLICR
jgi:nucleotide-binding universal stress UspA family protein